MSTAIASSDNHYVTKNQQNATDPAESKEHIDSSPLVPPSHTFSKIGTPNHSLLPGPNEASVIESVCSAYRMDTKAAQGW